MTDNERVESRGEFRRVVPEQTELGLGNSALVVIDVTNFDAHPKHGMARVLREEGVDLSYYWDRVDGLMMPNVARLVRAYREQGGRIVFTRVGGQFNDFGDSLCHLRELHRRSENQRGTEEFEVREELLPLVGEAVIDKPGSSAFTTGNLDVILRNAGVTHVAFCGVVTNACVLLSALSAWDLGYAVQIIDDACAADSEEIHTAALAVATWLGVKVVQTADVLTDIGVAESVV